MGSDTAADCEAAATGLGMADVTPDFIEGRIRSPGHLRRLGEGNCCIPGCFRRPVFAHHLTCGPEPKARGLKAGDNNAAGLCGWHHGPGYPGSLHDAGEELPWWLGQGLDPFALVAREWAASMALGIAYTLKRKGPRRPFRGKKKAAKERKPIRPMFGFP